MENVERRLKPTYAKIPIQVRRYIYTIFFLVHKDNWTFYMTHETHVKYLKIFFIFIAHSVRVYTVLY